MTLKEKEKFIRKQFKEAMKSHVTCKCNTCAPLRFMYRCLYCGEFFCLHCAEIHFGKTRSEYRREVIDKVLRDEYEDNDRRGS